MKGAARSLKKVAQVKVLVFRLLQALGNGVDVDVEEPLTEQGELLDPDLFVRFAPSRRQGG